MMTNLMAKSNLAMGYNDLHLKSLNFKTSLPLKTSLKSLSFDNELAKKKTRWVIRCSHLKSLPFTTSLPLTTSLPFKTSLPLKTSLKSLSLDNDLAKKKTRWVLKCSQNQEEDDDELKSMLHKYWKEEQKARAEKDNSLDMIRDFMARMDEFTERDEQILSLMRERLESYIDEHRKCIKQLRKLEKFLLGESFQVIFSVTSFLGQRS